ncbi:MAG: threonine--tRNA ligase [Alphaproteobacteria bacterium]|nr:threonine--tRNA ligase [Alphaproteobacteria bacterium]
MSNVATATKESLSFILPDGSVKSFPAPVTGSALAASIGAGLAKAALAVKLNGEMRDLTRTLETSGKVEIITRKSPEALELIRHDTAHVLAEAVQELFPGTQVTIGPSIENGFYYDFARDEPFSTEDFPKIEAKMREIMQRNKPIERQVLSRAEAISLFEKKGEGYKVELIRDLAEDQTITLYTQGDWCDLCRGPHLPTTGMIGSAFKLTKLAGAYWRGDNKNAMLQRIYGTAWRDDKELAEYLSMIEEAEKRDHRKLGRELDLFHFQDEAPGQVFWHPNGWTVYLTLMEYMRRVISCHGYTEINTPQMLDSSFWKASGHWDKYRPNMFVIEEEGHENPYAIKPMSCPGGAQVFLNGSRSYRQLPIRMAEFGHVFRRESSGARHGLMRVQAFTQDDAHIYCTPEQLEDEVVAMCDLIQNVYADLGLADSITVHFSTRPEQHIGTEEDWDRAEAALRHVCERINMKWVLNEGDGAFYAPKLDFVIKDALGREWQCGTIQVDMNMPRRLALSYIGEDGEKHVPHMIHRAILGSIERFIGVMIEHYAGKFPFWMAPVQVVVCTITNEADGYAQEVYQKLIKAGLRVQIDLRSEKINAKVRDHSLQKVPALFVVGKKEAESQSVAIRRMDGAAQEVLSLTEALQRLTLEATPPDLVRKK